jgi:dihydropteroate synthase
LNITADSFSDGGRFLDLGRAAEHAQRLAEEGAEIIDVGGESTRPGAEPVAEAEELRRIVPVIERLAGDSCPAISIDTMKPAVARAALAAGAEIINDVGGMREPAMRDLAAETGAGVIAMHMQGTPKTMQAAPHYEDIIAEIREFFRQTFAACLRSGMHPSRIALDPGIGFGKTVAHNLALLRNLESMRVEGRPFVIGASRKSFLSKITGTTALEDRYWPTVALTSYARSRGASVFRVHEARPNAEALRMTEAILAA